MPRYIDADALYEKIYPLDLVDKRLYTINAKAVADAIAKTPTADVVPSAEVEQLKRNLEQCENGYRQEMHLLQCKLTDATSGAEKQKLEIWRLQGEVEQLRHKYELAVAEREANVRGFTEELSKAKTEVARLQEDVDRLNDINGRLVSELAKAREQIEVMKRSEELDKIPKWL